MKLFFFLLILFLLLGGINSPFLYSIEPTGGIGVILEFLPPQKIHRVRAVFKGSPAAKAGIQPGEEIVAIDGQATAKMNFEELGQRIRGNPGEAVTLTLRPAGSSQTREVRLLRVNQKKVSPLILHASNFILTASEKNEIKKVILRLKTAEEKKKMEQLLMDFKNKKWSKEEFFRILRKEFPSFDRRAGSR